MSGDISISTRAPRNIGGMRFIIVGNDEPGTGWTLASFIVNNTQQDVEVLNNGAVDVDLTIDPIVLEVLDALLSLDVGQEWVHDEGAGGFTRYRRER